MDEAKKILLKAGFSEDDIECKIQKVSSGIAKDIIDEAKNGGYDLVILGKKGQSGLKEFFLEASKKLGSEFLSEVFEGEKPRDDRIILVDGRNIKDIRGKVRVKPESVVAVFPPMAGG